MENIFITDKPVAGESLIGYKQHSDELTKILSTTQNNIAIIGIAKSGKTSLVKKVIAELAEQKDKEKLITIYTDLKTCTTFEEMLESLVYDLFNELDGNEYIADDEILKKYQTKLENLSSNSQYRKTVQEIIIKALPKKRLSFNLDNRSI